MFNIYILCIKVENEIANLMRKKYLYNEQKYFWMLTIDITKHLTYKYEY